MKEAPKVRFLRMIVAMLAILSASGLGLQSPPSSSRAELPPQSGGAAYYASSINHTAIRAPAPIQPKLLPQVITSNETNYISPEWVLVYVTALLVAGTAVLAGYTYRLWQAAVRAANDASASATRQAEDVQHSIAIARDSADAAKRSSEISQKAFVATHRPWVKVEIEPRGPITYSGGAVSFDLTFKVMNIGHSPALSVSVVPRIILTFPIDAAIPTVELQKIVEHNKKYHSISWGVTIFPGDYATFPITVGVAREELGRVTATFGAIYPTLVGAAFYRTGLDEGVHFTSFHLEIRRHDRPRPYTDSGNLSPSAIWVAEGDVPRTEIHLVHSPVVASQAD